MFHIYNLFLLLNSIKKKKSKDKDKKSAIPGAQSSVPANIQIQQQFELLQQQQQSQQQHQQSTTPPTVSHLPTSMSSHSVSQSAPTGMSSSHSIMTASTISQPPTSTTSGCASPAPFKSLFRNLRVGSLKHQSPSSHAAQSPTTSHHLPATQEATSLSFKLDLNSTSPTKVKTKLIKRINLFKIDINYNKHIKIKNRQ